MMDRGLVRNLEQLQEDDPSSRTPRGVTVALVALGGACVVFSAMALSGRKSATEVRRIDPLGDLVATRGVKPEAPRGTTPPKATDLAASDVTFPGLLSDRTNPTTALAAVRGAGSGPAAGTPAAAVAVVPDPALPVPPAGDRLPVVPLPAQHVLQASPVVTRPRDSLTKAASESAQIAIAAAPSAGPGHEGGYQLQVSSFRAQPEAQAFADQLRARGHKAYVVEAHVTGRGTWYRVRVGPFSTQQQAAAYRSSFEGKEHVVPFLVLPSKDGARESTREAVR